MEEESPAPPILYLGLTDLPLGEKHIDLGGGIFIRGASATFMTPLTLINTDEESMEVQTGVLDADGMPPLPRPSFWQFGAKPIQITAEIGIPNTVHQTITQQYALARFIGSLLRLWANPAVRMPALAEQPFSELIKLDGQSPGVFPLETRERHITLGLDSDETMISGLTWLQDNWRVAHRLYATSGEFRLAADALDAAQFLESEALALVSLWAAMEALFSPSTSELKFRVSALIASFMEDQGAKRRARQKAVASLYDKRSAAAHGKPKHQTNDLVATFELLRRILIKMIQEKAVPSKEELEQRLFGG